MAEQVLDRSDTDESATWKSISYSRVPAIKRVRFGVLAQFYVGFVANYILLNPVESYYELVKSGNVLLLVHLEVGSRGVY